MTHTPGPWGVDAENISVGDESSFRPFAACGCCESPWMMAKDKDTQLADARLIAAAPDLLAALEEAVEMTSGDNRMVLVRAGWINTIAKARGQS